MSKKIISILLTAALLMGLCSVTAFGESEGMTPGTYSATVTGMKGDMTVTVTVDAEKILGIEVDTVDTVQIVGAVIDTMVPEIIEKQSISVDSVTGATFSSFAVKNAVRNCLEQAGADMDAFSVKPESESVALEDQTAEVVVVGSGAAGLSTAIQLAEAGIENVVVLEKNGYFGGTSGVSSGGAWAVGGTVFNEMTGYDYTLDELVAHMYAASGAAEGSLNDALIRHIAEVSADVFTEYAEGGAPWDLTQYTFGDNLYEMPVAWAKQFYETSWENGAGITLIRWLVNRAQELGVDLRLNSKVTGLVTDDSGAVIGVTVESKDGSYTMNAGNVVLATGGFQANSELLKEIAPSSAGAVSFTVSGSGDGIRMAQKLGAYVVGNKIGGARGLDMRLGYVGPIGTLVWAVGPVVNQEGLRFAAETDHYSYGFDQILAQTGAMVYGITDSTNAMKDAFDQAVELGYAFKTDTLAELGEALGLTDVDAFVATIEQYNADQAAGVDDSAFGVANSAMSPILAAPFYGIRTRAVSSFSLAGLAVDEDCRILREDGSAIPHLFGAGELICGNITGGERYTGSGSQVGSGLYEGKIIAEAIAEK